jgi:hypothetical protein
VDSYCDYTCRSYWAWHTRFFRGLMRSSSAPSTRGVQPGDRPE